MAEQSRRRARSLLRGIGLVALCLVLLAPPLARADEGRAASPPQAPCGIADTFDFPLGVPHGSDWVVFQSFGNPRAAKQGRSHTGEDWGRLRGGTSEGQAVYAIAAGQVRYAVPLAWGTEKGVIVVEHLLADGERLLSLYGHLDETESFPAAGHCVARGEPIGRIGDPVSGPHLHFEIRAILPDEPGPGYVWGDPAAQGWLSPTDIILRQRSRALPPAPYRFEYVEHSPREGTRDVTRGAGATARLVLALRNTGTATWHRDPGTAPDGRAVYLATGSTLAPVWDALGRPGHPSPFFRTGLDGWWPDEEHPSEARRIRLREAEVAPGEIGHFEATLDLQRGPRGRLRLWVTPEVTGLGPMGDIGIRWSFWSFSRGTYDLSPIAGDPRAPEFSRAERDFLGPVSPRR